MRININKNMRINYKYPIKNEGTYSLKDYFIALIFILMFTLIPVTFFYQHTKHIISSLKTMNYDNAIGTVTSTTVVDTGRTRILEDTDGNYRGTVKIYESEIVYWYQDNGEIKQNFSRNELNGKNEVNNFYEKYPKGTKIKLKINPRNRFDVIIKPNYALDIVLFIVFSFFYGLAFLWGICMLIGLKKELFGVNESNNPEVLLKLKEKFNSLKLKVITYNDIINQNFNIAEQLNWDSINNVSYHGYSHKILRNDSKLIIKQALPLFVYIIMTAFIIVGIYLLTTCKYIEGTLVLIFMVIVIYFMHPNKKINFDKENGLYYEGENYIVNNNFVNDKIKNVTPLSDIKALQITCYEDYIGSGNVMHLFCELNLILNKNIRIPIYKETNLKQILKLADQIAYFLHIKVLIGPRINEEILMKYL